MGGHKERRHKMGQKFGNNGQDFPETGESYESQRFRKYCKHQAGKIQRQPTIPRFHSKIAKTRTQGEKS